MPGKKTSALIDGWQRGKGERKFPLIFSLFGWKEKSNFFNFYCTQNAQLKKVSNFRVHVTMCQLAPINKLSAILEARSSLSWHNFVTFWCCNCCKLCSLIFNQSYSLNKANCFVWIIKFVTFFEKIKAETISGKKDSQFPTFTSIFFKIEATEIFKNEPKAKFCRKFRFYQFKLN